jgi:zinc transport system ATP-binding protein
MSIIARDLSFAYNSDNVIEGISFEIKERDFVAILGRNGSGKTTLVKLILGLLKPKEGYIRIFGKSAGDFQNNGSIGYVPQSHSIDKNFPGNVSELLSLGKNPSKAMKLLKIEELASKKFVELSGGQQQKVLIAMSLASSPRLLILDEPTVGVDIKSQQEFYGLLKKINKESKITIVMVTHDVGLISKYVKNVICINGKVCCCGSVHEAPKLMKKMYGTDFDFHHHH